MNIFSLLLFLSSSAFAADCQVIFIGGVQSRESAMAPCYPGFTVVGLSNAEAKLPGLIDKAAGDNSGTCYVFAGHSSGAIEAVRAASAVARKNPAMAKKSVFVVDFDGDAPDAALIAKLAGAKCVNALTGGQPSRNYGVATGCPKANQVTFVGPTPGADMYAHFFMINRHVPPTTSGGNYGSLGYSRCDPKDPLVEALKGANAADWNLCSDLCRHKAP